MRQVSLIVSLAICWLVLSGYFKPHLLAFGVLSVAFCAWMAWRMHATDEEGHPFGLVPRAVVYYPWLILEIMKSALAVSRIILSPNLRKAISPTLVRVPASQTTSAGVATYGNSITLTPGTITLKVTQRPGSGQELLVHALTRNGADDLAKGTMDRRVARFEGTGA